MCSKLLRCMDNSHSQHLWRPPFSPRESAWWTFVHVLIMNNRTLVCVLVWSFMLLVCLVIYCKDSWRLNLLCVLPLILSLLKKKNRSRLMYMWEYLESLSSRAWSRMSLLSLSSSTFPRNKSASFLILHASERIICSQWDPGWCCKTLSLHQ